MESNLNDVIEGWSEISLGDVLKYEQPYKYAVEDAHYNANSGIPVLTAGKSFILGYTNETSGVYSKLPIIIFDDFTTDCKYVDFPFKVKSSAMKFLNERNENEVDLKFIFEVLQTVKLRTTGGDHKRRWISEFSKIRIKAPKFSEQTRIAQILSKADAAITQTEALIAKYQRIKTGLMQDLLTKGIDEHGNIRSKQTHPFVMKNGIEVPEEWEVGCLATLIKAVDAHPSHRTPQSVENGIPYLGISDIDEYRNIDLKKCRKVSHLVLYEHNHRYQLRNGDIIFGKIGTIGEPKRLKAWQDVTISANVILIQPHNTPDFIFWVLNSEYILTQVKNTIHSTTQPAFGMEKIRALTILIPPKTEREDIERILNKMENNLISTRIKLQKLQSLKTGLMQDLLSGKVMVKMKEEVTA